MVKTLLILTLLILSSCGSFMNGIYRDLDRGAKKNMLSNNPQYKRHSKMKRGRFRNINDGRGKVVRKYQNSRVKRRATAEDLVDNAPSLSLWAGVNKDQNLFTEEVKKRNGDIVLINVESNLKDEISRELKRSFPTKQKVPKKSEDTGDKDVAATPAAPAPEDDKVESTVYDRISSVVIEEVNKNYLLIRGRKTVLFRKRKRLIELQALVSRRDITNEDSIASSNLLEATIHIVR